MKKAIAIATIAAASALSAQPASAWWGTGPFFGNGLGDAFAHGNMDFNMSFSSRAHARGYGYHTPYYGYAPYAYGYPVAPVAPVVPAAPAAEAK